LSSFGQQYAAALDDYMQYNETGSGRRQGESELVVWCSTMRCARETADRIKKAAYVEWRALREIEAGVCDGLTYEQIKVKFPTEYRAREQDKLRYRYPRGESYFDVITRLEPIIFELERNEKPLLIVAHQAVLRCLYAYFLDIPMEELPYLAIPLHTLIKLEPMAYGCKEKRVKILTGSELPRELEDQ
jgi:broad specificity phosphatase PhoE